MSGKVRIRQVTYMPLLSLWFGEVNLQMVDRDIVQRFS